MRLKVCLGCGLADWAEELDDPGRTCPGCGGRDFRDAPADLASCQRLAAAVVAQAFNDLENGTEDQHERANYYLTRTFWQEGHLWADLVRHVIVEERVREKIAAAAARWRANLVERMACFLADGRAWESMTGWKIRIRTEPKKKGRTSRPATALETEALDKALRRQGRMG